MRKLPLEACDCTRGAQLTHARGALLFPDSCASGDRLWSFLLPQLLSAQLTVATQPPTLPTCFTNLLLFFQRPRSVPVRSRPLLSPQPGTPGPDLPMPGSVQVSPLQAAFLDPLISDAPAM